MNPDRTKAPAINPMGHLSIPPLKSEVTAAGTGIHTVSGGDADVTRITVMIRGGISEMPEVEYASLIAPLWIEGTRSDSGSEIADFFDYRGSWIKSETGIHYLSLTINALNSNVDEIIPMIGRIIAEPSFDEAGLRQIALRTASRLDVDRAKVGWHATSCLNRLVYGGHHPLAADPLPERILEVKAGELRDYYASVLHPANVEFFISGKVMPSTLEAISRLEIPAVGKPTELIRQPFEPSADHSVRHITRPDAQQSAVRMGLVLPGRQNPDFVALRLLVTALGGYFGSRLMLDIREEKGLTYGINALTLGYVHDSLMSISSETDAAHVSPLIDATIAEIERMKDPASYSAEEMERLRSFVLSNLAAMLDTPLTVMDHYRSACVAGAAPDYFSQQLRAARSMTAESLAALARRYFDTSKLYIATAGK